MTQPKALKHLKKAWAVTSCAALVFLASVTLSHNVNAQPPSNQTMIYEVYAGGIHAVQGTLNVKTTLDNRYDIDLSARTRGWLASLAPWEGTFESNGWIVPKHDYRPEIHKSTAVWREEKEIKEYQYTKDRRFKGLLVTDHDQPTHKKEIDDTLTQGTTDVLTATLAAMQSVADGKKCEGTSEVFDGKRRFAMRFTDQGETQLNATKYNIYEGPAMICTVEVEPAGGEWHKKPRGWLSIQEQGRERGTMPTVWMAKIDKNAPAVPIKILVKTAYGSLFMHLAEYRNGDNIMVAEKRVTDEE